MKRSFKQVTKKHEGVARPRAGQNGRLPEPPPLPPCPLREPPHTPGLGTRGKHPWPPSAAPSRWGRQKRALRKYCWLACTRGAGLSNLSPCTAIDAAVPMLALACVRTRMGRGGTPARPPLTLPGLGLGGGGLPQPQPEAVLAGSSLALLYSSGG